ncbi:MAG: hypothetical protein K0R01_34 [Mycobacterium sp.]|jgi:hypothetical protein|nr:hypothetical protein [Mycobacterium sp.]
MERVERERWSRHHLENLEDVTIVLAETVATLTTWHQGLLKPEKLTLPGQASTND